MGQKIRLSPEQESELHRICDELMKSRPVMSLYENAWMGRYRNDGGNRITCPAPNYDQSEEEWADE